MTAQERTAAALQGDYAFPRELYETDEQWKAQGFFQRHPEEPSLFTELLCRAAPAKE